VKMCNDCKQATTTTTARATAAETSPTTSSKVHTLVRLPTILSADEWQWKVAGGLSDKLHITTSVSITLIGISLLGTGTPTNVSGKITILRGSSALQDTPFSYVAKQDTGFLDKALDAPVVLDAGVQYTMALEYFGNGIKINYGLYGTSPISYSATCGEVVFTFKRVPDGGTFILSYLTVGQFPRILFSC